MECKLKEKSLISPPQNLHDTLHGQWHLEEHDFFSGLPELKEDFISVSTKRQISRNQFIFCEGERGDSTFYIESGEVKTFRITSSGEECIFFIRTSGDIFGLSEVIGLNIRKANAQALTACSVFEIKKNEFEGLLSRHIAFARKMMEDQAKRIRYLCDQVENLMMCDVSNRLLKLFIYLSYEKLSASLAYEEPVSVPVRLTQEHIASMTGCCQQTVSEVLKRLKEDGYISVSRKEIILLKPKKILKYLEMI
ncbi:MAG: Crp/Fnr family transcriptional regulator [Nitrospirae bacterium]|nr:Crp/Fnr family transcriptional regulator [Nitrospirota bacterium]